MIIFFISIHFTISIFFIPLVSNFHPVSFSFDFRASFNTFLVQFTSDKFFHHLLVWKSTYFTIIFNNNEVIIMGIEFYADRRGVCVCVCVFLFSTLNTAFYYVLPSIYYGKFYSLILILLHTPCVFPLTALKILILLLFFSNLIMSCFGVFTFILEACWDSWIYVFIFS